MSRSHPRLRDRPSILFVTATRIGDAVLSTGLLRHLIERYPGARFTIAAGPAAAPVFAAIPGLERVIDVAKRHHGMHWPVLWRQVALRRWDLVVDLRGSALAWLVPTLRRRIGGKGKPSEHRVVQLSRLFALDPPPAPMIWTDDRHEAAAERMIPAGGTVLGVAPSANWGGKMWPVERFVELVGRLSGPGGRFADARIAVFAAPHERQLALPIIEAVSPERLLDLTHEPDLLTVAACLRRVQLFIGNDTGLMHIAAAVGTPTLGLFGPSPARQYAPWGSATAVAQTDLSYEQLVGAPDFDYRSHRSLMNTLSVDTAEREALGLAERATGRG